MTCPEPFHDELTASLAMLQLQLGISNNTDDLMDALIQQEAVIKGWASIAKEVHLPSWAIICGVVLLVAMGFYLVNYMLWAQREKASRMQDLEDAKNHSEHGNMLGSLIEAGCFRTKKGSPSD